MEVLERSVRCMGLRNRSQFEAHAVFEFPLHCAEPIGGSIPLLLLILVDLPDRPGAVSPSGTCCRYFCCSPPADPGLAALVVNARWRVDPCRSLQICRGHLCGFLFHVKHRTEPPPRAGVDGFTGVLKAQHERSCRSMRREVGTNHDEITTNQRISYARCRSR